MGLQKAGVIFSPINFRLAEGEIALHIDDSRPRILMYDVDVQEVVHKALGIARHTPDLVVSVGEAERHENTIPYDEFLARQPDHNPETPAVGPFDEIVRLYTPGTTGAPKGVPLNNVNNMVRSCDVLIHSPLNPRDKTMNMTPWFHAGGLHSGGPCPSLHPGAHIVGFKTFNPRAVLDAVEQYKLTFLIGAPANLEMLSQAQTKHPRDIGSLEGIVTMGAPLNREACLRYHELLTPNIFNGYGTTETFWNSFLRPYDLPDKAGSAGRSCTDDVVRVVKIREDKDHAEPDDLVARDSSEEGEVIIQTLKAPYGYFNKPEEDRRHYYKGWYYTKDIATWNQEGYITICGRGDDMIISEGENIHPAQVEAIINQMTEVQDCIVVGIPDHVRGQALAAYVVKNDENLTSKELSQFLTAHPGLAKFKRPRYIKFVPELPLTATGKKKYYVLRDMALRDLAQGALKRP